MNKKRMILVFVFLIIFSFHISSCFASDLKVKSMAHMSLIIEDVDNQLNLYDFGANPAWLVMDQQRTWLRPFFTTDYHSGNFRRVYDPGSILDFNALVEGVKVLDKNQVFRGLVDYHDLNLNDVYQSISRDPYQQHPFRLADNTTGNIHYWGPTVAARYSRQLLPQKLFWGASLDYQIETGLKDFFPQPRTIYRYVRLGTGVAYRISDRLAIGSTFSYSHTQEFTEAIPPSSNDPRAILVMKFRGETIGSERLGNMERFTRTKMFRWGMQLHFRPINNLESGLVFYYHVADLDATESRTVPVKDGSWQLQGYEIHWKNRYKFSSLPFGLGFSFDRIDYNDWAVHPNFQVLLGDDYFTENRIGVGLAYEPISLRWMVGVEYHLSFADKEKKDYVSRLNASGNINRNELKIGAELGIINNWKVRAGFIYQQNSIDPSLLLFSEYLAKHSNDCFTFGLAHQLKSADLEIYGYYGEQKPTAEPGDLKRNQFGLVVSMKFYRD